MKRKLQYRPELYLGESILPSKLDNIKKKLERHPDRSGFYLIALSRNPSDQLEILQARQLTQTYYETYPVRVVGIASDYDEALALVEKIVLECLQTRGDCALKEYLTCWI